MSSYPYCKIDKAGLGPLFSEETAQWLRKVKCVVHSDKAKKNHNWNWKPRSLFLNPELCTPKLCVFYKSFCKQTGFYEIWLNAETALGWDHLYSSSPQNPGPWATTQTFPCYFLPIQQRRDPLFPISWVVGEVLFRLCTSSEWGAEQMIDSGLRIENCPPKFLCWNLNSQCDGIIGGKRLVPF